MPLETDVGGKQSLCYVAHPGLAAVTTDKRPHTPRERLLEILELKCIVIHMIQIWTFVCIINIWSFSTCVRWVYFGLKMHCFFPLSICVQPLCSIGKELL